MCSTIAIQVQAVAVGWQIYDLTHSPLALGLVGLAQFLPMLGLILFAGHAADRYDRRLVLRLCLTVQAFAVGVLAAGTLGGWITRDIIFPTVFVLGAARAFESPALSSLLPTIVPAELFPRAVASSASANQFATIAGPAIGGLVYAASPVAAYSLATTLLVVGAIMIGLLRTDRPKIAREPVSRAALFAGFAYIRRHPIILGAISLDLFAVLLGGATALLPLFARDILETGPWGLGLLRASPAAGALVTSVVLIYRPLRGGVGRIMFGAVTVFGLATIVFALSRSLPLSMMALAVLGAADVVSVVIRSTLVQLETPDAMRGRVSAVNSLFIGTSNQLGEFESGVTAAWFGAVPAVVLGGVGTLLVVVICMRLFPELLAADRLHNRRAGATDS
jgi:MFS family permease